MSQRSKNLLEAFTRSKAPEKSAQPVAQPRGSTPRAGGPFADPGPAPRPKPEPRAAEPQPAQEAPRSAAAPLRIALLCSVVAVTFFFLGRFSAPGVQAADTSAPPLAVPAGAPPGSTPAPAKSEPAPPQAIAEALTNPANKYSILAATYKLSDEEERLGKAARDRLVQLGLPATLYRNPDKKHIYLLVGAAPKLGDLDTLLVKVKQATSDRGKLDFVTAHSALIDNYLVR